MLDGSPMKEMNIIINKIFFYEHFKTGGCVELVLAVEPITK